MNPYENFYPVIAPLLMCKGVGDGKTTSCVMAQAATIDALRKGKTLDAPTDKMECACPVLRRVAICLNDGNWWKSDEERTEALRPLIPLLLDSKGDLELTRKRIYHFANHSIKVITPMRMGWIASSRKGDAKARILEFSKRFSEIEDITDLPSAKRVKSAAHAANAYDAAAYATYAADAAYADAADAAYADAADAAYADAADADAADAAYADAAYADAAYADAADAYAQRIKYRDSLLKTFMETAAMK